MDWGRGFARRGIPCRNLVGIMGIRGWSALTAKIEPGAQVQRNIMGGKMICYNILLTG
jgi:hypothetical protein